MAGYRRSLALLLEGAGRRGAFSWKRVAGYSMVAGLIVLLLGRLLGLPVAVAIVAGHSMEPTIKYGDIVVLKRVSPKEVKPGMIVLWCITTTRCVLHRVVEIRGSMLVTKGDANPMPDPPVPLDRARYVMVLKIPRIVYVAPLFALLATAVLRAGIGAVAVTRWDIVWLVVSLYGLILLAAPMYAPYPAYYYNELSALRPMVTLKQVNVDDNGSVTIVYHVERTVMENVDSCVARIQGENIYYPCKAWLTAGNHTGDVVVRVQPSQALYQEAYRKGATRFELHLSIKLSYGLLESRIPFIYTWKRLSLELVGSRQGCMLRVENPNPAGTSMRIEAAYRVAVAGKVFVGKRTLDTSIPPLSTLEIPLGVRGGVVVRVSYTGPGGGEVATTLYGGC